LSIGEVSDHVPCLWAEADAVRIQVNAPSRNLARQQPQEISPVDADVGCSHQPFPPPGPALEMGEGSTDRGQSIGQT